MRKFLCWGGAPRGTAFGALCGVTRGCVAAVGGGEQLVRALAQQVRARERLARFERRLVADECEVVVPQRETLGGRAARGLAQQVGDVREEAQVLVYVLRLEEVDRVADAIPFDEHRLAAEMRGAR